MAVLPHLIFFYYYNDFSFYCFGSKTSGAFIIKLTSYFHCHFQQATIAGTIVNGEVRWFLSKSNSKGLRYGQEYTIFFIW